MAVADSRRADARVAVCICAALVMAADLEGRGRSARGFAETRGPGERQEKEVAVVLAAATRLSVVEVVQSGAGASSFA